MVFSYYIWRKSFLLLVAVMLSILQTTYAAYPEKDKNFPQAIFNLTVNGGWDYFVYMKAGNSGVFYLSGYNSIVRLDRNGNFIWDVYTDYRPYPSMAIDGSDNLYIITHDWGNALDRLMRYNKDGILTGNIELPYSGWEYSVMAMGVAANKANGDVYVCGAYYDEVNAGYKTYIARYDKDLNLLDAKTYGVTSEYYHYALPEAGIDLDKEGNVYVGGDIYVGGKGYSYMVIKFSADLGNMTVLEKEAEFEGGPLLFFRANPSGGAVIVGSNENVNNEARGVLRYVDKDGNWSGFKVFNEIEWVENLFMDEKGNSYITSINKYGYPVMAKIGSDMNYVWEPSYLRLEEVMDIEGVYVDNEDRIYLSGYKGYINEKDTYYLDRYIQEAVGRYSITEFTGDEQVVAVSSTTEPMISFVSETGTTNPAQNILVNFSISTYPAGSQGQTLTKFSETTNQQGLASTQLRLGNIPAEYGVTAKCDDCISEANSVTFTCCGKLAIDEFRQNDDRWGNDILGSNSPVYRIRETGCALTSVANLINFYAAISTSIIRTDPGKLNQEMIIFNAYNNNDDVLWDMVPDLINGIKFAGLIRVTDNHPLTIVISLIDEYLLRGLPVIIHALRPNGRDHFVLAIGKCRNRYIIADPAVGIVNDYNPYDPQLMLQGVRLYEPL